MQYVVGLGSNLGSRRANLRSAVALIEALDDVTLRALSPVYRSAPVGPPQPDFDNAAVRLDSALSPQALLAQLQAIERRLGRERREQRARWGPRILDLDLLWASSPVAEPGLKVPHARLHERPFALAPLLDVAPALRDAYAAQLQALGGAPVQSRALAREARIPTVADPVARFVVRGEGDCFEDALAEALVALGRQQGACGIAHEVVVTGADSAALIVAAIAEIGAGFLPLQVSVSPLHPQPCARLYGQRRPPGHAHRALAVLDVAHSQHSGSHALCIELVSAPARV